MPNSSHTPNKRKSLGQAMLEFALALPVLLMVVYGLIETGRLLFIYASVVTAARQAARYGSASGDITGVGDYYYQDCTGIRSAAKAVGFLQRFNDSDIQIAYDTGPGSELVDTGHGAGGTDCPIDPLSDNQHRIDVRVSTLFTPIVPLVPFRPFTITSTSNRTILTGVSVAIENAGLPAASSTGGEVTITKGASRSTFDTAGQVITYTYNITNNGTGDVTGVQLFDSRILGGATNIYCGASTTLTAGTSQSCTANYTVTQGDVDLGATTGAAIVNDATVRGFDSAGQPLAATVSFSVAFQALPKLKLEKTGTAPAIVASGNPVTYYLKLTNTGNIDLHDPFTITDNPTLASLTCPPAGTTIPRASGTNPGGSVQCIGTYILKQSDVNAGYVDDTATATAKFGSTGTISSNVATAHVETPKLYVTLTADKTSISQIGETIRFFFDLKNNTTNTLRNLTVTDTRGANKLACIATLDPGALATKACYHDYITTLADFNAGTLLTNSATADAQGGNMNSNIANLGITVNQLPVIVVNKTATTCLPSDATCTVGQTITYSYSMVVGGNVTLHPTAATPFTITDDKIPGLPAGCSVSSGSFDPGTTIILAASCTRTHTIQEADIDAGSIVNTATGSGVFGATPITAAKVYSLQTYYGPRLTLVKTADRTYFTAGSQTINYTYGVKNTGNVSLTLSAPYNLSDSWLTAITPTCAGGVLAPGALQPCGTAPYTTIDSDTVVQNIISPAAGSTVSVTPPGSGTVVVVNGQWTASKLTCTPGSLSFSLSPASGTSISVNFTNTTGAAVPVQAASLSWTGGGNVTGFAFGSGPNLWPTAGTSIYTIPSGWSIPSGSSTATMTFSTTVSSVSMYAMSFPSDTGCATIQ